LRRADASRLRSSPVLIIPAFVGALMALAPLAYLAVRSSEQGLGVIWDELSRPQTRLFLGRSVLLALTTTALCTFLGVAAALLVGTTNVAGRRVWEIALALPLAVPTYVAAYTWLGSFDDPSPFFGALGVLTVCSYPYVYIPVLAAVKRLDASQVEIARSLGSSQRDVLMRVTLPHLRPAITSGALLVALYALSDFGAVSLMRYDTLTQGVYLSYVGSFDRTPAAILGCLLVALSAVVIVVERRSRAAHNVSTSSRTVVRPGTSLRLGRYQPVSVAALCALVGAGVGIPVVALSRRTMRTGVTDFGLLRNTIWSTLLAAVLGACACLALAVPIAVLNARYRSRVSSALESAAYLGHALPGLVIALSLVFLGVRFLTPIYQRLPLLVVAYVVLFLPLAVASARPSITQASPRLEEMGRSLGVGRLAVLRRVTLPIAAPGIAGGGALVALTCVKELPATLLLRPTGFETLATRVWSDTSIADYGSAAPFAIAMVLLGVLPMMILRRTSQL
jgi:iron(III) transport system permease protein